MEAMATPNTDLPPPTNGRTSPLREIRCTILERGHYYLIHAIRHTPRQ